MMSRKQKKEQQLLSQSAMVMAAIGAAGILIGTLSGSKAVLTDGIFSALAVLIKLLMLGTSRLITKETSVRFQFGYWQMEPMVLFTEGAFTFIVVFYAAAEGISGLLGGGHDVDFGLAMYYGILFEALAGAFYFHIRRQNRTLRSNLVRYDTVSWYIDMVLAAGLLLSFLGAWALQFTAYAWMARYIDPVIMLALALHMIVPAFHILSPAFQQMLGVAPEDVHEHVQQVMDESMEEYGFKDYVSSVQQYGNTKIIEIDILVDEDYPVQDIAEFDRIRNDIDHAIGYPENQKWLTISFTTTRRWMARDYMAEGNA